MRKILIKRRRLLSLLLIVGMIVGSIPTSSFAVQAASVETVYAAAYEDAQAISDTTLPQSMSINGTTQNITWNIQETTFAERYGTVAVKGTAADGTSVNAQVEVIPSKANELVYFVDASRSAAAGSKAFDSVKGLVPGLKNSVPDQVYDENTGWGRVGTNFKEKGTSNIDVTKKIQTGWYSSSKTQSLVYNFKLTAGEYTLTAGFHEWWNGRSMKIALSGDGLTSVTSGAIPVSGAGSSAVESVKFTVNSDCTVKMEIQNATGGEAPVISWFAVAKGEFKEKVVPVNADVVINGSDVEAAAKNVNGLTYKGLGLLSGNSTSDLLMDYKTEAPDVYQTMLNELFGGEHPLITHIKMEMGNDGNNSTGADSCTMRFEDEEADASRSPGFQLAADAKKINPNIKTSFLRWNMPAWVKSAWTNDKTGEGYKAMYKWYRETIFDVYEKYGYIVDFISPDTNETSTPDGEFIKWFADKIANETDFPSYMDEAAKKAYNNIKIIASDENQTLNIVPAMRKDSALYDAVDIVGFHYNTGTQSTTADYRTMADVDDKEVWYSEGCANFSLTSLQENKNANGYGNETIGGYQSPLALADAFVKSFVESRKTHYIFQPAIGSFYEGAQYDHKEILSAREPWAGYVRYDEIIYLLEHFTKFAKLGWENSSNTAGIWRAIPQSSANGSTGTEHIKNEAGSPSYITLAAPDKSEFSTIIVNNSEKIQYYTITANDMNLEENQALEIWETMTDSYLQYKGEAQKNGSSWRVEVEPFSMVTLTTLDCDGKDEYTHRIPAEGTKSVLDTDFTGKNQNTEDNYLYADDFEYAGYSSDYLAGRGNEPRYIVDLSGAFVVQNGVLKQLLNEKVGEWNPNNPNCTVGDFRWANYKASVDVVVNKDSYAGINIRQQTGMGFEGSGYNLQIKADGSWTLKKRGTVLASGSVIADEKAEYNIALEGKGAAITAYIDGRAVANYIDPNPEYFGRVRLGCGYNETSFDNLKVEKIEGYVPYATKMTDNADDSVSYTGSWNIIAGAGGSSNDWYRSTSTSTEAGSSFTFNMSGDGFALIGGNDGSAVIDVKVDGNTSAADESTNSSSQHTSTYMLMGLGDGDHTVTVILKSGKLVLDAIYEVPYIADSMSDKQVVEAETVNTAVVIGNTPVLPEKVKCTLANGDEEEREIDWYTDNLVLNAYDKVTILGAVKNDGFLVTANVEVIPENLVYFVDAGTGIGYSDKKTQAAVSVPYNSIKAAAASLINVVSDAAYTEESGWGYIVDSSHIMNSTKDGGDRPQSFTSNDKYSVGLRDKTKGAVPMTYKFKLTPGEYEITVGYHEFYGSGRSRDMQPSVSWTDLCGIEQKVEGAVVQLRSADQKDSFKFTLDTETTVEFKLAYLANEAGMFSWIGIAKTAEVEAADYTAEVLQSALDSQSAEIKTKTDSGYIQTESTAVPYSTAVKTAESLIDADSKNKAAIKSALEKLTQTYEALKYTKNYNSFTGAKGTQSEEWLDTDGSFIQAHGGQVQWLDTLDLNGDGVNEGGYIWYGEDKTRGGKPIDGIRCYTSPDLYNWTDHGTVLATHDVVPAKLTADKAGVEENTEALADIKNWAKMTAASDEVTQEQIDMAKNFVEAYTNADGSYDEANLSLAFKNLYTGYCIVERPKMLYNETTKKYVLVFHADGPTDANIVTFLKDGTSPSRYSRACMGFAVSDTPYGPFELVNVQRMNYEEDTASISYYTDKGMARDMNVFIDDNDINGDGVKDAYAIYSSEQNKYMYISLLNNEYTAPIANGSTKTITQNGKEIQTFESRVLGNSINREAPALFKFGEYYYMITSGTSGWNPNAATYYRSKNIYGPYEAMGDPCVGDNASLTFSSQSTCVFPIDAQNGKFIYMGDRWLVGGTGSADWYSSYVWLPVEIHSDNTIVLRNTEDWNMNDAVYFVDMDKYATTDIKAENLGGSGGQSDNSAVLVAVNTQNNAGNSTNAPFIAGETASKWEGPLGSSRMGCIVYELPAGLIADQIVSAEVSFNVKSVNNNIGSQWTKAGLYVADATKETAVVTNADTFKAVNNDYSASAVIWGDKKISKTNLGEVKFDVTEAVKAAAVSGKTSIVFRVQTVIAGFNIDKNADKYPSMTLVTKEAIVDNTAENDKLQADLDAIVLRNTDDLRGNINLPVKGSKYGYTISWSSSDSSVVSDTGVVSRGAEDVKVTLTAKITGVENTSLAVEKQFELNVAKSPETKNMGAYLFAYFTGESTATGEQIYFATSEDGLHWTSMNNGAPVLTSTLGEKGLRDPFIMRSPEGDKFYLIATDLKINGGSGWTVAQTSGSKSIMVWESTDLINWSEQRMVEVAAEGAGCTWAPEAFYDDATGEYIVFWSSKIPTSQNVENNDYTHRIYYATTRDFYDFSEPKIWAELHNPDGKTISVIDANVIKVGDTYYRFTKNEASEKHKDGYPETGKYVILEKSESLLGTWTEIESEYLKSNKYVEGATSFKFNNEDKWCLLLDDFGGKGYYPAITTDIASGVFTALDASEYSFPSTMRHGTVMPITVDEYIDIQKKYNPNYKEFSVITELPEFIDKDSLDKLPQMVEIQYDVVNKKDSKVEWTVESGDISAAGTFVNVKGTLKNYKDGTQTFTHQVFVLSDKMKYFIDCGITGDKTSSMFGKVKAKTSIVNESADAEYSEETGWGYDGSSIGGTKGYSAEYGSLMETGYYGKSPKNVTYYLTLDAGEYNLVSGLYEWWTTEKRATDIIVSYENSDGSKYEKVLDTIELTQKGQKHIASNIFTVAEDNTKVSIKYAKNSAGTQDGVIAYIAVTQTKEAESKVDKSNLQAAVNEAKTISSEGYTEDSYDAFAEALTNAEGILAKDDAGKQEVDDALALLQKAKDGLVKEEPSTEEPSTEEPTSTEEPSTEAPSTEEPTSTEAPSTEEPSTEEPTSTEAPSTEAPSTEEPTSTEAPSTEAPSTEVDIEVDNKNPDIDVNFNMNFDNILDKVFTEDDLKQIAQGVVADIVLKVEDISEKVEDFIKDQIDSIIDKDTKIAQYYDITLTKQLGNEEAVSISNTNGELSLSVKVPENAVLRDDTLYTRVYNMLRIHEGIVDVLPAEYDKETNTLTFKTDRFSVYVLVYEDIEKETQTPTEAPTEPSTEVPTEPSSEQITSSEATTVRGEGASAVVDTGDSSHTLLYTLLLVVSLLTAAGVIVYSGKSKKRNDEK